MVRFPMWDLINYTEYLKMQKPYFVLLKFDSDSGQWYEAGSSHYTLDEVRADAEYEDDGEPMRVLKIFDERDFLSVFFKAKKLC